MLTLSHENRKTTIGDTCLVYVDGDGLFSNGTETEGEARHVPEIRDKLYM